MNKYLVRPWFIYRRNKYLSHYLNECISKKVQPGLHVGCGDRPIPGWFNGDVARLGGLVQFVNAVKPLPFPSETFQYVFSEHFIEHLTFAQGESFFHEAYRTLKKGGILRTATPDLEFIKDLMDQKSEVHQRYVEWTNQSFLPNQPRSAVSSINLLFYGWGHKFIYNSQYMIEVLKRVGFKEFKTFKSGQSDLPELSRLEQHGKSVPPEFNEIETMVVEAMK